MRKSWVSLLLAAVLAPSLTNAAVHITNNPDLTAAPNNGNGVSGNGVANYNGTGIWFNPLTGYFESRGYTFPNPLFEDGKFLLLYNSIYGESEIWTEGFFSNGNGVLYDSSFNLNPKRFADGDVIGPGVGYNSPGAGFTDLGPNFGGWAATGGHGYLGLVIHDPSSASPADVFYGYAEIQLNPDDNYAVTLLSFAYNDVRGQAITTVSSVPEPTALALVPVALAAAAAFRRRRA